MPELPEVETVCGGIRPVLEHKFITKVIVNRPDLRFPIPLNLGRVLEGRKITRVFRRAKYMLWQVETGEIVLCHLGMSGRYTILPKQSYQPQKHDHLIFETAEGMVLVYHDPRRFGFIDVIAPDQMETHKLLKDIGPEPLGNDFSGESLQKALQGKKSSIKAALLNQKIVAGLGNIYVCEALYEAKISPTRQASSLTEDEIEVLVPVIRDVLQTAIRAGGSTLKDYAQANGDLGYFQHQFKVYGREGEVCLHCQGQKLDTTPVIQRIIQQNRSSFYCPLCQR